MNAKIRANRVRSPRRGGLLMALLALLGMGAWTSPAAAQDSYGTIKGRLVYGGNQAPEPDVVVKKGDPNAKDSAVCATQEIVSKDLSVDPRTKGVSNGFAYLVKPSGKNPEAERALLSRTAKVEIDQKNCQFIPYSTAMHKDQELDFKSSDPVNHNVRYNAFKNAPFNQILPPNGEAKVKLVAENRPLPLACDIHPWMKGYIMVFDHPFFAVTRDDGSFEIRGVPAGSQNLVVWQGSTGYVTQGGGKGIAVNVKPGEVTDVGEIKLDPAKVKKR